MVKYMVTLNVYLLHFQHQLTNMALPPELFVRFHKSDKKFCSEYPPPMASW